MAGLIFIEPKSKMENDLIHLSKLGIEITAEYFANDFERQIQQTFQATKLPSQFQIATLEAIGSSPRGITAKTT